MHHNFSIFQDFILFYLNLRVYVFHMYSESDGLFPGPESPSPELIFLAGDLARGAHLRWRSVSMRRQLVACVETPTAEFKRPHCASTMAWLGSYHDREWFL